MTTETITVDIQDGWRSIVCTGTVLHIMSIINNSIRIRFGINSTSDGFVLNPGNTITVNETVYVRGHDQIPGSVPTVICVVKD